VVAGPRSRAGRNVDGTNFGTNFGAESAVALLVLNVPPLAGLLQQEIVTPVDILRIRRPSKSRSWSAREWHTPVVG